MRVYSGTRDGLISGQTFRSNRRAGCAYVSDVNWLSPCIVQGLVWHNRIELYRLRST